MLHSRTTASRALAVLTVACAAPISVCALGVYAVVAYDVARERREIGVRVAIGATSRAVARSVVVPNARALGLGVAIGSVSAVLCAQSLRSVLFGIGAFDPMALTGVVIALAVTILLALIRLVVRVTRVDPEELLRAE